MVKGNSLVERLGTTIVEIGTCVADTSEGRRSPLTVRRATERRRALDGVGPGREKLKESKTPRQNRLGPVGRRESVGVPVGELIAHIVEQQIAIDPLDVAEAFVMTRCATKAIEP